MNCRIFIAKCVSLIVALQLLNISIYAQDIDMLQKPDVIAYSNDINSIAEFIGEVVLKHVDAFPEHPNDGHKDFQFSKHIDLNDFAFQPYKIQDETKIYSKFIIPNKIDYDFLFFKEINPPPPKA